MIKNEFRTFFPKGNVAKAIGIENTLPFISEDICLMIVKMCEDTLKKSLRRTSKSRKSIFWMNS